MGWLESIFFGLISGISEFLPVSSSAHQLIMMRLFGVDRPDPVRGLFIHGAMLFAAVECSRAILDMVRREGFARSQGGHIRRQSSRYSQIQRLIRGAIAPMVLIMFFLRYTLPTENNLLLTSLFLIINGAILFLPERMIQSNKDAGAMSFLDSVLIGCSASLSAFSGISRTGCVYSMSVTRGAEKKNAISWAILLSVPALAFMILTDIFAIFAGGAANFWSNLISYLLMAVATYAGCRIGIFTIRSVLFRSGNSGFAYYCWGAALLSFVIYLTVG